MTTPVLEKNVLLAHDAGLASQCIVFEEDVVGKASRLSGADHRRNARLEGLRALVPTGNAILGIDLADVKQHAVLCDHDSRVLKRWKVDAKAWQLGVLLDRALAEAVKLGFASVTVACEPTGHRWQIVGQLARERGLAMVCIQPLAMRRAREQEDFTTGKTDAKDSVLIARLAARLHCYVPEDIDQTWGQLRHLGARRHDLVVRSGAARQQMRDLLECVWPAALAAAPKCTFDSATWLACVDVALRGGDGRPERVHSDGLGAFSAAVREALPRFGGVKLRRGIVAAMFVALADPTGVHSRRAGALQRVGWVLQDWRLTVASLTEVEQHMVDVLDELGLRELLTSIPGLSAVGAAAILAESGDLARFSHSRALVKHSGLAPRAYESGEYSGTTRVSGRGRSGLRLAAWRAIFGALPHNPVLGERYLHLTTRTDNPLSDGQARASLAASLLRWIYAVVTQATPFNAVEAGGRRQLALAA